MRLRTKILWSFAAAFFVLLIAAGTIIVFKYRQVMASDETPQIISGTVLQPDGDKPLGVNLLISAMVKTGWNKAPQEIIYNPPKGIRVAGAPKIILDKIGFGYFQWKLLIDAIPYRTGDIAASSFEAAILADGRGRDDAKNISVNVPAFKVSPLNVSGNELALASKINDRKSSYKMIFAGILILMAIAGLVYYFFFRKKAAVQVIVTPWGAALMELCELRRKMKSGKIPLEFCVLSLTDIVRVYLEKRFSLNAPAQTTYEFLQDLERPGSPLADGHRGFLKDFMISADLVKFANLPAEVKLFDDAAEKAELLICETKPAEENRENKK